LLYAGPNLSFICSRLGSSLKALGSRLVLIQVVYYTYWSMMQTGLNLDGLLHILVYDADWSLFKWSITHIGL